jgi:hypothetical protein
MSARHLRHDLRAAAVAALTAAGLTVSAGGDLRPRGRAAWPRIDVATSGDEWALATMGGRARRLVSLVVRVRLGEDAGAAISQDAADALAFQIEGAIYAAPAVQALGVIASGATQCDFSDRGDTSITALEISFVVQCVTDPSNPAAAQ